MTLDDILRKTAMYGAIGTSIINGGLAFASYQDNSFLKASLGSSLLGTYKRYWSPDCFGDPSIPKNCPITKTSIETYDADKLWADVSKDSSGPKWGRPIVYAALAPAKFSPLAELSEGTRKTLAYPTDPILEGVGGIIAAAILRKKKK